MRRFISALALALVLVAGGQAQAHKVVASAYVEGDVVEGEIGFSNGDVAADALVEVFDDAGAKIGEARTDKDGVFRYKPTRQLAHVFRADLGAGHVAKVRMPADELPGAVGVTVTESVVAAEGAQPVMPASAEQRAMIAEAVREEIKPLRREIAAYKEKNDLQSILGGIGYIIGLFGVGYYLAARHKLRTV